jgi:hypothetical protein
MAGYHALSFKSANIITFDVRQERCEVWSFAPTFVGFLHGFVVKVKLFRYAMQATRGRGHNSYTFLTLTLDGGEWSALLPGRALLLGKDPRYPLERRLSGPYSWSGLRG